MLLNITEFAQHNSDRFKTTMQALHSRTSPEQLPKMAAELWTRRTEQLEQEGVQYSCGAVSATRQRHVSPTNPENERPGSTRPFQITGADFTSIDA
jgi:hypothetical protein